MNMFEWFDKLSLLPSVISVREFLAYNINFLPDWIKYCLPDALWVYSFTSFLIITLSGKLNVSQLNFYLLLPSCIGVFSELGQLTGAIPGTYDFQDILSYSTAGLLAYVLCSDRQLLFNFNKQPT